MPLWEITDEEWHLGIDTNLSGTFFCCRAAGKYLITQKSGKVINIASGFGFRGRRNGYMYGIAKAGVIQLTRALALTWAQDNIQVNCIVPGLIDVSSLQPESLPQDITRRMSATGAMGSFVPVGRVGIPSDIGSMALFLASDASGYITGGVFAVEGGGLAAGYTPVGYAPFITMKEE